MSKQRHESETRPKAEHGTTRSYVIGFILSLILTAIPYFLVTGQAVTGNALLAIVLAVAFLQMAVQILFFLHLGRGPKPLYNVVFFVATFGAIVVVVVGSVWIMGHLHANMAPAQAAKNLVEKEGIYQIEGQKTGACPGDHTNHRIIIRGGMAGPGNITARLCDTLTFTNEDDVTREMAFGTHSNHQTYAGESELSLRRGRNKTITLTEAGTYQFHDHLDPGVAGFFTVAP